MLFTHPVGCSRLLSAVKDLTTSKFLKKKKKTCQSFTLSGLVKKRLQQVALFFDAAHSTSSEVIDFREFMSSTSGHSTAIMRHWMKKTTNAISDTGRKELVQVTLLQIHGGDFLVLLGNLIGASSVHFCQACSARYTSFSYLSLVLLRGWAIGVIFLCQLVRLDALLLNPANLELRITIYWISLETVVNFIIFF